MSDKFKIHKTDDLLIPWALEYPYGFTDSIITSERWGTFDEAVDSFIKCQDLRCPNCGRGTVVDTLTGWTCTSCLSYDTAVPR